MPRRENKVRLIKMFGLAAVAAVAAMAFVGASSAMAGNSLLCLNDTVAEAPTATACNSPTTVHYLTVKVTLDENGEELTTDAKSALLASGFPTVECEILIAGDVLDQTLVTNGPVRVQVLELNYSSCNNGCTVTVKELGTILILRTAVELASVTGDNFKVKLNCPFFECDYNASNLTGHGLGPLKGDTGGKGHVTYTAQEANLEQDLFSPFGSCPAHSFLDALFQSLVPVYIRE
jgi:hypothetical protein